MANMFWAIEKIRYFILAVGVVGAAAVLFHGCSQSTEGGSGEGKGWQIVVKRFDDAYRDQKAGIIYNSLIRVRGIDPQQVRKTAYTDTIVVSYGCYANLDDPNARKDLQYIKSLMIPNEGFYFLDAHLEPIPDPDPPIAPDWVITHTKGYWTLQIAQFHGQNRKLAAVQLVTELRKDGTPAYVYHGPVKSFVTIGSYPENAVTTRGPREVSQQLRALDPELKGWKAKYPYLIVNTGYARFRQSQGQKTAEAVRFPSQIIKIPRPGVSMW